MAHSLRLTESRTRARGSTAAEGVKYRSDVYVNYRRVCQRNAGMGRRHHHGTLTTTTQPPTQRSCVSVETLLCEVYTLKSAQPACVRSILPCGHGLLHFQKSMQRQGLRLCRLRTLPRHSALPVVSCEDVAILQLWRLIVACLPAQHTDNYGDDVGAKRICSCGHLRGQHADLTVRGCCGRLFYR